MNYPDDFMYTKEHEWIKVEGKVATIGVTKFAVEQLGDVVHLDLPKVGTTFKAGDTFGTIESTKTVSDLYLPSAGKVVEVNTSLAEAPEDIESDPHGKCWLIKIELQETVSTGLLNAKEYEKYIGEESGR